MCDLAGVLPKHAGFRSAMTLNDTAFWVAVGHSNVCIGRAGSSSPPPPSGSRGIRNPPLPLSPISNPLLTGGRIFFCLGVPKGGGCL